MPIFNTTPRKARNSSTVTSTHECHVDLFESLFWVILFRAYLFVSVTIFSISSSVKNNLKKSRGLVQSTGICGPSFLTPEIKSNLFGGLSSMVTSFHGRLSLVSLTSSSLLEVDGNGIVLLLLFTMISLSLLKSLSFSSFSLSSTKLVKLFLSHSSLSPNESIKNSSSLLSISFTISPRESFFDILTV